MSSLIEEAITSSQLEGAATTRQVAKDMIRSGRPPRTKGERMILNNFAGLSFIESHRVSHAIVYQTARSDLLALVEMGLLEKSHAGRKHVFRPVPHLAAALATLGR